MKAILKIPSIILVSVSVIGLLNKIYDYYYIGDILDMAEYISFIILGIYFIVIGNKQRKKQINIKVK